MLQASGYLHSWRGVHIIGAMDRRQEILDAAAGVFARHGFRGSTTRRIADAAGVNEITIFRHFGTKDLLIREAMRHMTQSAGLTRLPASPVDPERELAEWGQAFMAHLRLRSSIIRKTMGELEERPEMCECASAVPRQASSDLCEYLTALKREGFTREKFEPRTASAMLMGAIFSDAMGREMMSDVFPQPETKAAQLYARLLLRAIGVESRGHRTTYKQTKRKNKLSA
jgi:AcrR family transcriptional regulator